jgi:tetratricopeptide (TPR) repeat protein
MPDVFISHSSNDDTIVTEIHDELQKLTRVEIWVDHKDIPAGAIWEEEIERALRECPYLLLVISRESIQSKEVRAEWRAAITFSHKLLLVVIDDIPTTDIPPRLLLHQFVKWSDSGAAKIAAAINGDDGDASAFTPSPIILREPIPRDLMNIPMLGRDLDLAEAQNLVKTGVLQILGVGGRGKSRLAVEMILHMDDVRGAVWHECSDVSRPDEVIELLRDHFSLPLTAARPDVLARLRDQPHLIVLDNGESVREGDPRRQIYADLVEALARATARVVLTSRVEWGEIRPPKRKFEPRQLDDDGARQVTLEMMKAFGIIGLESRASDIAHEARNHPGLIQWAVGQIEHSTVERVLRDLHDLRGRDLQKALNGMILKTLHQMETADGGQVASWVLKRLNVCRGGFTRDAATAICLINHQSDSPDTVETHGGGTGITPLTADDDLENALHLLQTYRFVILDPAKQRYTVNTLAQEVIGTDTTAHNAHYDYFRVLARLHNDKQNFAGLDVESDNLEAAFERAFEAEDYARAYKVANACLFFLANRGRFDQRRDWLERVTPRLTGYPDQDLNGSIHNTLGIMYWGHPTGDRAGNLHRAIAAYKQALVYRTPQASARNYSMTQNNLGNAYRDLSVMEDREFNLRRAITAFESALVYRTPQVAPLAYAGTLNNLGVAYRNLSEIEDLAENLRRAITAYEQALVYFTPHSAPLDYAMTQNNMAEVYRSLAQDGDREANLKHAIAAYQDALRFRTEQAAPVDYSNTQWGMGDAYKDLGNLKAAVACWREAERVYRLVGMTEQAGKMARLISDADIQ